MPKQQFKIQLDDDVVSRLDGLATRYGMSGNSLAAAVLYEFSRIAPEAVWQAMGQIAAEHAPAAVVATNQVKRIPTPRHSKRLPVSKAVDVVAG